MTQPPRKTTTSRAAAAIGLAATLLAGCGAGGEDDPGTAPVSDAGYREILAYCGATEPAGGPAQPGGWELHPYSHYESPAYDVTSLVSPAGATLNEALRVQVDIHNYRGITGTFIGAGYQEPEWKMGVILGTALPARSAACVTSLAKVVSPPWMPVIPGVTQPQQPGNTLSWRSKWAQSVPVDTVPGAVIDGFEYVSTFDAPGAQAFFVLSKTRYAGSAGLSICYQAPSGGAWDCAAAEASDLGKDWGLARRGVKSGVYVIAAPKS